jgi:hypothetical protein
LSNHADTLKSAVGAAWDDFKTHQR